MRVAVLGCGRWGSFQAWYAARLGHDAAIWGAGTARACARCPKTQQF